MAVQINKDTVAKALKRLGDVLGRQLDYVFLGILGLVTLVVAMIYGSEITTPTPTVTEPKPITLEPKITTKEGDATSEAYFAVFEMIEPPPPFEQTEYQQLIDFNMFDAKAARDAEELHDEAKKRLNDAEDAFEKGNYEAAKRLAEEALDRAPTMQAAVRLIDRIEAATAPSEEAGEGDADGEDDGEDEGEASAQEDIETPSEEEL